MAISADGQDPLGSAPPSSRSRSRSGSHRPLFDREPTPAPVRLGRFDLIERIGAGGMAEVFRAAVNGPQGFQRELVVKRVLPQLSAKERFTQMFVNEAKISALLAHPNIVQIFEFGESDGAYFIAMESVRGLTLREVLIKLREQGRIMPLVAAAEIVREVLIALDYAHNLRGSDGRALEIIHRDISPSNVMLAETGAVKVLDFGIARAADIVADDEGQVVKGKIAYLAPEQISCGAIDARVDVFATGCVMYELLTGRVMFRAQNDLQKKVDLLNQASAPPSAWNADVPAALDRIVARATARDIEARYASAADMLTDLENYLAAFRSSSRSVLRLVRSLLGNHVDESGAGELPTGARTAAPSMNGPPATQAANPLPGDAGAQVTVAAPNTDSPGPAERGRPLPGMPAPASPGGARLPGEPPRAYETPRNTKASTRVERFDDPHTSAVSRGEVAGTATYSALLRGPGSAEHNRMTRNVWQRRIGMVSIALIAFALLGGIVTGARTLVGRVSSAGTHRGGAAASPTTTGNFVLMTFISTPPGARIIDAGGRILGQTPTTLPIPTGTSAAQYRFEKDGYRGATASETANGDKTIEVELRPIRRVEKAAKRSGAARQPSKTR